MTETCPLLDGQLPTNHAGFVVNKDLPEPCLKCLYRALYGQFGYYMLETHAEDPELAPSHVGIKRINSSLSPFDGSIVDRHGVLDYKGAPDAISFGCNIERSQSDTRQELIDIEAVKNMSTPEQVAWLISNFDCQTLQQACAGANLHEEAAEKLQQ